MEADNAAGQEVSTGVTPGVRRMSRSVVGASVLLLVLHATLTYLARPPGIATRQDDAMYLLLAESLADFGYHEIFRTDAPVHRQYPPAYPAALALWRAVVGDGYDRTAALTVIASVAALGITFLAVTRLFGALIGLCALALLALNPYVIQFGGSVATEAPLALCIAATLALLAFPAQTTGGGRALLAGVMTQLAFLVRVAALPLTAAVSLHWLLERRWKRAVVLITGTAVLSGAWFMFAAGGSEQFVGRSYVADITSPGAWQSGPAALFGRLVRRIPLYLGRHVPWVLPLPAVPGTPIDNLIFAGSASLALVAGTVVLLRRWRPAGLFLVLYGAMLVVWPFSHERFLIPILLVIIPALLVGAGAIGRWHGRRLEIACVLVATLLVGATAVVQTRDLVATRMACDRSGPYPPAECVPRDVASWFAGLGWIDSNTPADAVFLTMKPEPLYYYARRLTIGSRLAISQPADGFVEHLRERGVDYVFIGSVQAREPGLLADLMAANCTWFDPVQFFPSRTWLFALRPAGDPDPEQAGCEAIQAYRVANRGRDFQNPSR